MYVNPFLVVQNSKYTKHFYIEGQRIVSKIGASSQAQFVKSTHAGDSLVSPIQWDKKKEHSKDIIIANFEALGLDGAVFTAGKSGKIPYGQIKKYLNSGGSVINPGGGGRSITPGKIAENLQFYYHPDHLGSSNYITDATGEVYQHEEYFPFGETLVEERNSAEYTTYLFNGKELDEETGLYYYGARYYDPRISIWYGVDPLAEKYYSWSPYAYVGDNPINIIDPNGMDWYQDEKGNTIWKKGSEEIEGYKNLGANYSYRQGDITVSYEQDKVVSLEEHVLDKKDYVSDRPQGSKTMECYIATKMMTEKSGAETLNGQTNGIITGKETKTKDGYRVNPTADASKGIDYINSQVDQGRSVAIGVDYGYGHGKNDGTTDHWVAIASRITNFKTGEVSFSFFDSGTQWPERGRSGVFSLNSNNLLTGTGKIKGDPGYTVSQIRKNKK
jgi:RHS repeat-associated protein